MKITLRIKNPQVSKQINNILATIPTEAHNAFWMTGIGLALSVRSKVASQEDYARMVDGILNNDILIIPKGGKVTMSEDGMSGSFEMPKEEEQRIANATIVHSEGCPFATAPCTCNL